MPASGQRQHEWSKLKSTVLVELFKHAGYTFPQEITNYIEQGAVEKVEEWAHKMKQRQQNNQIHILPAYFAMAYMFAVGLRVEINNQKALEWKQKASKYFASPGIFFGNKVMIVYDFFKHLAEWIDPAVLYYKRAVALYKEGVELRKKTLNAKPLLDESFKLMRKAAHLGYPPALLNTAIVILQNREQLQYERLLPEAFELMKKAANITDRV